MDKKELRKQVRTLKAKHTEEQRREWSEAVCRKVINDGLWRSAGTVLLYHALNDEVDTQLLIDHAASMGKRILLPVVVGNELELRFYEGLDNMKRGPFGIMEPSGTLFPASRYSEINLAIIPGMAFDPHGNRLGRGKGYYDRLLPQLSMAYRIGVCWHFQFMDCIPSEPHDIRMNEVLTD